MNPVLETDSPKAAVSPTLPMREWQVQPPKQMLKMADHHWLEAFDIDGHSHGLVVLQWNPAAGQWSHSGNMATGMYVNTMYWKHIKHCPLP